MEVYARKQITFDLDTNLLKELFGEENYTRGWNDIRRVLEQNGFEHVQGSVYSSAEEISDAEALHIIRELKERYPYFNKIVRDCRKTDIAVKTYSINDEFEYDGTLGDLLSKTNENSLSGKRDFQMPTYEALDQAIEDALDEVAMTQSEHRPRTR